MSYKAFRLNIIKKLSNSEIGLMKLRSLSRWKTKIRLLCKKILRRLLCEVFVL